ncbi:3-oxoacyl-ACP synthase [Roseovarius sp. A46]|uniref:BrnA antitoxin family protein n=1 Tax=Roseovarius sp. A46 TaxID=2109331 RepID=UPI001011FB39|nr:BrnA antitoxin family protein [Roseovarius sp. A46]RXV66954.1 3-oxoacyl-ACP synthase [Roseovarius sp. A46]
MSDDTITRMSLDEIRRQKGQSDWERVEREAEQDAAAADDPVFDEPEWDFARAIFVEAGGLDLDDLPEAKKPISLRVDRDVLDFFKRQGKGYQTRMNAVLRAYMEAVEKKG